MNCNYCGHALSKNSPVCPHCKRIMSEEQLELRKEMNGVNNPYMERLNKLGRDKIKYNLFSNEQPINIKAYLVIIAIIILIIILAFVLQGVNYEYINTMFKNLFC